MSYAGFVNGERDILICFPSNNGGADIRPRGHWCIILTHKEDRLFSSYSVELGDFHPNGARSACHVPLLKSDFLILQEVFPSVERLYNEKIRVPDYIERRMNAYGAMPMRRTVLRFSDNDIFLMRMMTLSE